MAPSVQALPDQHTDFPFQIAVESWWPVALLVCGVGVGVFVYRRRRQ
jgi:cell division protein FtsW (lipid II flippase)